MHVTPPPPLDTEGPATSGRPWLAWATAGAGWAAAAWASWALHGQVDLGSQALPVVMAAAFSGLWLRPWAAAAACVVAMLAFNWSFVPPEGTLQVDLRADLLLLVAMLTVSVGVALLVARQRAATEREALNARRVRELLGLGERLRATQGLDDLREVLARFVQPFGIASLALIARADEAAPTAEPRSAGELTADEHAGLRQCLQQGVAFGPGTGRYAQQPQLYLPMRGQQGAVGAALLRPLSGTVPDAEAWQHAQAACDQAGMVLERAQALRAAERQARRAGEQQLRSTILAAVSHDYRTPLAVILGAASSLQEQGDRLGADQRRRLAAQIVDEVEQLDRVTDNALQLARLDAPAAEVPMDWESAEELVGSVLARVRLRSPAQRVRARIEPGLPFVRCNAVLVVQLIDNLIDNALKHGPEDGPVEVLVQQAGQALLIAVRDRGPGVPAAWRERIFEVFQRVEDGAGRAAAPLDARRPRGAGVGLAVCRAIARVHGGQLTLRERSHGGSSFELRLPMAAAAPQPPPEVEADGGHPR